jgi:hypothetical protein
MSITLDETEMWEVRDGTRVRISDMTPRHAENAYRLLLRQAESLAFRAVLLLPPPNFNGDMAQYYAEQEWEALTDAMMQDPVAWLERQPLVKALRARAAEWDPWA